VRALRTRDALDNQLRVATADVDNSQRSVRIAISAVVQAEGGANAVLARYLETRRGGGTAARGAEFPLLP
jgi:hypothetical protein